jgi:uncharacterized protein (UPF0335 family)
MPKKPPSGHNSLDPRLTEHVERIECLSLEKTAIGDDIKDVYATAKAQGYDTPTIRNVIRLRKMESEKRKAISGMARNSQHSAHLSPSMISRRTSTRPSGFSAWTGGRNDAEDFHNHRQNASPHRHARNPQERLPRLP